jgi:hypothetical protein
MKNRNDWLEELAQTVAEYEHRVEEARRAVELARTRLVGAERDFELARSFWELEKGKVSAESPLNEVSLKEACVRAVREKGRATIKEITEWLEIHGMRLDTNFPGRAVHAALMHASGVKKVAPGTYEADQLSLPLGSV